MSAQKLYAACLIVFSLFIGCLLLLSALSHYFIFAHHYNPGFTILYFSTCCDIVHHYALRLESVSCTFAPFALLYTFGPEKLSNQHRGV